MRQFLALVLLASLAPTLEATAFDHYDPTALGESAAAYIRDGDWNTARILLERAARLAPHDHRVQRHLQQLKARMEGTPAPAEVGTPPTEDRPDDRVLPEPPAIWNAK